MRYWNFRLGANMNELDEIASTNALLDSDIFAIPTEQGQITLRDILTATFKSQEWDTRFRAKFLGQQKSTVIGIVSLIPNANSATMSDDTLAKVQDSLTELVYSGLVSAEKHYNILGQWNSHVFGVTRKGRAFVDYGTSGERNEETEIT